MPYIYILKSLKNGRYYVRSTIDLDRRLEEHNQKKSKYTREAGPFVLVYKQVFDTPKEARQREYQVKKMKSRVYIEKLIKTGA